MHKLLEMLLYRVLLKWMGEPLPPPVAFGPLWIRSCCPETGKLVEWEIGGDVDGFGEITWSRPAANEESQRNRDEIEKSYAAGHRATRFKFSKDDPPELYVQVWTGTNPAE